MHPSMLFPSIITLFIASAAAGTPCTTTSTTTASCNNGSPTETVFGSTTETATISVNCHGCETLTYSYAFHACPEYIVVPTTTVTDPTSVTTTIVCSKTP